MPGDDDFLKFFSDTLAHVTGVTAEPEPPKTPAPQPKAAPKASLEGKSLVYVGFDDATRTVFQQNLGDRLPFVETADLQQLKAMIVKNQIALIVFDGTSFIKPGIAVTKFVKEKNLPIRIAHVYGEMRVTEEYEKYRQYHLNVQPDYRGLTDEIFTVIDRIAKDFGL